MNNELKQYIEAEILPRYDGFDAAHRRDHVDMVIAQSMEIAQHYVVDENMVYAIAAYHDIGLAVDRKTHHLVSGEIVRGDARLQEWFSAEHIGSGDMPVLATPRMMALMENASMLAVAGDLIHAIKQINQFLQSIN